MSSREGEPAHRVMRWGIDRSLDFTNRPLIMGVINCTPDSFYASSRVAALEEAAALARRLIGEGADLLDVGGESTRPGSDPVDAEEERRRVVPVIEAIRRESAIPISVDTRKAAVAAAALDAGADIVNDVSALAHDRELAPLAARRGVPVVLMHLRGEPKTMQQAPHYDDTVAEVRAELEAAVARAQGAGIARERIILDPGIGFGKRLCDNLVILRELGALKALGFPILVGLSRKSFLGRITGVDDPGERLIGTVVANSYATLAGADLLRVHDVLAAVQMRQVLSAIERGE